MPCSPPRCAAYAGRRRRGPQAGRSGMSASMVSERPATGAAKHGGPIQGFFAPAGAPRLPQIDRGEGIYLWDTEGSRTHRRLLRTGRRKYRARQSARAGGDGRAGTEDRLRRAGAVRERPGDRARRPGHRARRSRAGTRLLRLRRLGGDRIGDQARPPSRRRTRRDRPLEGDRPRSPAITARRSARSPQAATPMPSRSSAR